MRKFSLSNYDPDRITVVLLNGGGQQPFNKFNKITKLFRTYDCNILSVELPGHGKSAFDKIVTAEEMLADFYDEFNLMLDEFEKIALVGFSLGALLSLKSLEQNSRHFEFVVTIGAGLAISEEEERIMKEYASIEFFDKMGWLKYMFEYHKDGWRQLIGSLPPMLSVGSSLFVSSQFSTSSPLHLIIGDHDGVVNYDLQQEYTKEKTISTHLVPNTSHFDYFSVSWSQTSQILNEIIANYLNESEELS